MADLISRDDYREILDEQLRHYDDGTNPFHMQILKLQREILDDILTIDAIPVDWLDDRANDITRAPLYRRYAQMLMDEWQKEQEAHST